MIPTRATLVLSAFLLQLLFVLAPATPAGAGEATAPPDIHTMLMHKFETMNGKEEGIFHQDVTSLLAPYFPVGQSQADTQRVVAEQKLGSLRPFMGVNDAGMGRMFVTQFILVNHMSGQVLVVLDFDFDDGPYGTSRLKQMRAYLRASNM